MALCFADEGTTNDIANGCTVVPLHVSDRWEEAVPANPSNDPRDICQINFERYWDERPACVDSRIESLML
jgi:hypothetical protein